MARRILRGAEGDVAGPVRRRTDREETRTRQEATLVQPRDLVGLHLTGNLATDTTHAACTLLYDARQGTWRHEWASRLDLEWLRLPPVLQPWEVVGQLRPAISAATGLPAGVQVVVGGADSLCAALGVGATTPGVLSDASGSSTCLDLPLEEPDCSPAASLYPHVVPDVWCADTGMNATGAVLEWAATLDRRRPGGAGGPRRDGSARMRGGLILAGAG